MTRTALPALVLIACVAAPGPEVTPVDVLRRGVQIGVLLDTDPWRDTYTAVPPVVGDLDGDGWLDLVGGQARQRGAPTQGIVAVWSGGPAGFPAAPTWSAQAPRAGLCGAPMAWVGDTDGDAAAEIAVGAPCFERGQPEEGLLALATVRPGALGPPTWVAEGGGPHAELGWDVAALGDANGDGYQDVLATARVQPAARAWYGGPGGAGPAPDWTASIGSANGNPGSALAAGDLDDDGYADAFVADDLAIVGAVGGAGEVWGFRGGPAGLEPSPSWTLDAAPTASARFGWAVEVLPDLDGDGLVEIAVGAPGFDERRGRVDVFRGSAAGPLPAASWSFVGADPGDEVGRSIASGDVDGDGLPDLLMSVETDWTDLAGTVENTGGVAVVLGVPGGLAGEVAFTHRGPEGIASGQGLQAADLDRDGYDDVLTLVGSFAGADTLVFHGGPDADGDGAPDARDCAPAEPTVYAGADETPYDGVDQDCRGDDDFDVDRDGIRAEPWGTDPLDLEARVWMPFTLAGSCTGVLELRIEGATPGATVQLHHGAPIASTDQGWPIVGGLPCGGTWTDLDLQFTGAPIGAAVADATGTVSVLVQSPPGACGTAVQAVDLGTCGLTPALVVPP